MIYTEGFVNKVKTLLLNISSSMYMRSMLEDYFNSGKLTTENIDNFLNIDLIRLKVINSILLIALYKEELVKDKKSSQINENLFELMLNGLIEKEDDKYKLGELEFDNKPALVNVIRNKLLHGDFVFNDNNQEIVIDHRGLKATLSYEKIIELGMRITATEDIKATGEVKRKAFFMDAAKIMKMPSYNFSINFDKVAEHCFQIYIYEEPEDGYERDADYINCIESFMADLKNIGQSDERKIRYLVNNYKDKFSANHIKFRYEIKKFHELENYEELKQIYKKNQSSYAKHMASYNKNMLFAITCMRCSEQGAEKLTVESGLIGYNRGLDSLINKDYLHVTNDIIPLSDRIIAMSLNVFYSAYQYGLETIYSQGKETNLKDNMLMASLPFERLDLSNFVDENMVIVDDFSRFYTQYDELEKELQEIKKEYSRELKEFNYKVSSGSLSREEFEEERKRMSALEFKCNHLERIYNSATEFMTYAFDNYVLNYNIIYHIRNALSHGNISIGPAGEGNNLYDRIITIEDKRKGNTTYKKEVTYKEFSQLMNGYNINIIVDYFSQVYGIDLIEIFDSRKKERKDTKKY